MNSKVLKRKIKFIGSPLKNTLTNAGYKRNHIYAKYYENKEVINNTILYESRDGKSLTDSPYAIFKFLINHPRFKEYKHIWSIQSFSEVEFIIKRYKDLDNVIFVKRNSNKYLEYLTTAKYLINNSTFQPFFIPKEDQIYINTWHGTPLKKMGFEIPGNPSTSKNVVRNFLSSKYLISPNAHTTSMYTKSYKLDGLYNGTIIEDGYPRIDLTLNTSKESMIDQLLPLGLQVDFNKKTVLYAPTWKGVNVNQAQNDMEQIIADMNILKENIGNEYNILVKVHPFLYPTAKKNKEIENILVPDYIDTNELLSAVDLLITDYSSIFFDYLVTDKPILFYMWDAEYYIESRGSYLEFDQLPGPILYNINELTKAINNIDTIASEYKETYSRLKEEFTQYDDGKVTSRLIDYIFSGNSKNMNLIQNLDNKKEKILFYPGGMMNNGITSSFLNLMNNIDYDKYDVSIFMKVPNKIEALKNIEKINKHARLLFKHGISVYTLNENYRDRLCHNRGVGKEYLKRAYPDKAYEREGRRFFGESEFDFAIDFSGYSLFWAKYLLASNAKKKICYMHNDILSDSERTINGKRPHYINLRGLFSVYNRFDKLVSVSKGTMELNMKNLSMYANENKFDYIVNSINPEKILQHRRNGNEILKEEDNFVLLNKKFVARARIVNTDDFDIWNKPIHDALAKIVSSARNFANQEVTISWVTETAEGKYYKFSTNDVIVGWIDEKALKILPDSIIQHQKVNQLAIVKRSKKNPIWNKPYNLYNSSKVSYSGQYKNIIVDVLEISKTQHSLYSLISINNTTLGWIDSSSLDIVKDYTLTSKSVLKINKEKNKLKKKNYQTHKKVIDNLSNRTLRDRYIGKKGIVLDLNLFKIWNKIPSNPDSKEVIDIPDILNKEVSITRRIINKNGVFYLIHYAGDRIGWINRKAIKVIPNKGTISEQEVYYQGLISTKNHSIKIKEVGKDKFTILNNNNDYDYQWFNITKEISMNDDTYCCIESEGKIIGWINKDGVIKVKKKGIKVNGDIIANPSKSNFNFVNMGRLSPEKAQSNLIKAFAEVQKDFSNSMLYILGQGPLKNDLQKLIEELQLEEHVILTGQQEEPFRILDMCDCFVLSSHYEGQPMVLLEALTLGLDIVATDIVANRTVLENGKYGVLVEDSIEGLKVGLKNYIKNDYSKTSKNFNYQEYNIKAMKDFYKVIHY